MNKIYVLVLGIFSFLIGLYHVVYLPIKDNEKKIIPLIIGICAFIVSIYFFVLFLLFGKYYSY